MAAIRAADADTLAGVDGIGTEKARVIVAELVELAPLLDKLQAQQVGTQVTEPQKPATEANDGEDPAGGPLAGQAVVVTGSMTGPLAVLSRNEMNEMNELIERAGGKASSSVSKRTTLLVAGEKAGSKRAKAEELGIRILDPEEFAVLLALLVGGSNPAAIRAALRPCSARPGRHRRRTSVVRVCSTGASHPPSRPRTPSSPPPTHPGQPGAWEGASIALSRSAGATPSSCSGARPY